MIAIQVLERAQAEVRNGHCPTLPPSFLHSLVHWEVCRYAHHCRSPHAKTLFEQLNFIKLVKTFAKQFAHHKRPKSQALEELFVSSLSQMPTADLFLGMFERVNQSLRKHMPSPERMVNTIVLNDTNTPIDAAMERVLPWAQSHPKRGADEHVSPLRSAIHVGLTRLLDQISQAFPSSIRAKELLHSIVVAEDHQAFAWFADHPLIAQHMTQNPETLVNFLGYVSTNFSSFSKMVLNHYQAALAQALKKTIQHSHSVTFFFAHTSYTITPQPQADVLARLLWICDGEEGANVLLKGLAGTVDIEGHFQQMMKYGLFAQATHCLPWVSDEAIEALVGTLSSAQVDKMAEIPTLYSRFMKQTLKQAVQPLCSGNREVSRRM